MSESMNSPGALLRQGRLAAGLHIAALAVSLKVPVRRLEALESDRFDLLPDAVFVRALASSVCRALKIDAAPVLALLPQSIPPRLGATDQRALDPYTSADAGRRVPFLRSLSRPVAAFASALVVATLALLAWPLWQGSGEPVTDAVAGLVTAPAPMTAPDALTPAELVEQGTGQGAADTAPLGAPVTVLPSASVAALPAVPTVPAVSVAPASPASPAVVVALAAPSAAALSPAGIIVFRPSEQSWIEVTDANGVVLLRRMLAPGEVVGTSGVLPLSAVVGRADATQVQVRGKAFDLSSIARENVARFEVK